MTMADLPAIILAVGGVFGMVGQGMLAFAAIFVAGLLWVLM